MIIDRLFYYLIRKPIGAIIDAYVKASDNMRRKLPFKLPCRATMWGVIVLGGTLIVNELITERHFPKDPLQIVLNRDISMTVANKLEPAEGKPWKDKVIAKLHKGDKVSFLGVVPAEFNRPDGLLVQTKNGERGLLSTVDLGYPLFLRDKYDDPSPVKVLRTVYENNYPRYEIQRATGEKETVHIEAVRPVLPPEMRDRIIRRKGDYYMTQDKFEKLYLGATMAENDARYRPAMHIDKTANGWEAYYPNLEVIQFSTGRKYNPTITYDANGIAQSYIFEPISRPSKDHWVIMIMPLLGRITNIDFFAHFIEGSLYTSWIDLYMNVYDETPQLKPSDVPFKEWLGLFLWLVCGAIWLLLTGAMVPILLDAGLYCRHLFYFIPDTVLEPAFVILTIASTYIWIVLGLVWGGPWFLLGIPVVLVVAFSTASTCTRLLDREPHQRCLKCRRMERIVFTGTKILREQDEWGSESVATSSVTKKWKTWTDRITRRTNESDKVTAENIRDHKLTTTQYDDYDVKYHIVISGKYYECQCCHNVEEVLSMSKREIARAKKGQHSETKEETSIGSEPTASERQNSTGHRTFFT